jgi:hypothetical protein
MELRLHPRILIWVQVLIIVGVFQSIAAIGQVCRGSSANLQSAETPIGHATPPAAAEPRFLLPVSMTAPLLCYSFLPDTEQPRRSS